MKPIAWSKRARSQLAAAFEYIAQDDADAAQTILDAIIQSAERLREFERLGPPARLGTRKLTVIGTRYALIYRITANELRIVAVWHSAQLQP
jgi:plasmid stabilization system protein ParE